MPTQAAKTSPSGASVAVCGIGNNTPPPRRYGRQAAATMDAIATGTKLRGFHSNSNSSTASSMAATGVPNVALMPAAAPATSSVLRSAVDRWKNCANSEPKAPPVMMIGPSAPKGRRCRSRSRTTAA